MLCFANFRNIRDRQVRAQSMHLFKALYLKKMAIIIWFFTLLKRYGPNLQNDTNLETTSCFIADKMASKERSFSVESLLMVLILQLSPYRYLLVNYKRDSLLSRHLQHEASTQLVLILKKSVSNANAIRKNPLRIILV